MYEHILNGLYAANQLTTEQQKINYLRSLQPHVKSLRNSYNAYPVVIDYSDANIQASYLITYFPQYTELLTYALSMAGEIIANEHINSLIFFGSGPCPEIIGYLDYIRIFTPNLARQLNISIFDIAATNWQYSRDIIFNQVVPNWLNVGSSIGRLSPKDLRIDVSFNASNLNSNKKLVVFQNCLNEIEEVNHPVVLTNVEFVYNALPPASYIVIIDIHGYRSVIQLIQTIEDKLANTGTAEIVRSISGMGLRRGTKYSPSPIIKENLLTGENGLIPKYWLNFNYSIIKKN